MQSPLHVLPNLQAIWFQVPFPHKPWDNVHFFARNFERLLQRKQVSQWTSHHRFSLSHALHHERWRFKVAAQRPWHLQCFHCQFYPWFWTSRVQQLVCGQDETSTSDTLLRPFCTWESFVGSGVLNNFQERWMQHIWIHDFAYSKRMQTLDYWYRFELGAFKTLWSHYYS